MITIIARNEIEAVEQLFNSEIDLGAFFQAVLDKLGCSASSAQAKAVFKESTERKKKKAQIDEWRERGELRTYESFPKEFAEAVKKVYRIDLKRRIEEMAKSRPAFIEYLGTVYFSEGGYGAIQTDLIAERTMKEWDCVKKFL